MAAKDETKLTTRTADMLKEAMDAQNLSIRDVELKVGKTYEHIRNILAPGTKVVPSRDLVKVLAKVLKINLKELERVAVADRIRLKHGDVALELMGQNPELEPIERVWPKLTKEHKADIIAMTQTFAKRDAAASRES
jgi:transcriptional regulator with XRE-family HTH domain